MALTTGRGTELAELVRSFNERWTVAEMSERAKRQGFSISPSELAAYAADDVDARPLEREVRALAAALGLDVGVVRMAAARQFPVAPRARREAPRDPAPAFAVRDTQTALPVATTRPGADREQLFLWARLILGTAATVSCVVLIYLCLEPLTDPLSAAVGTIAATGAPVVFMGVRLVVYLNAYERQSPVDFWPPGDSSDAANWGLALLLLNVFAVALVAFFKLDDLWFHGQLAALLESLSSG